MSGGKWVTYLKQQYKRGWNEIPVVFCSAHFAIGSLFFLPYLMYRKEKDVYKNRFKQTLFICRPGDPRLEGTIRLHDSPPVTKL